MRSNNPYSGVMSRTQAEQIRRTRGRKGSVTRNRAADMEEAATRYKAGENAREIAKDLSVHYRTVLEWARKQGVKIRPRGRVPKVKPTRKNDYNWKRTAAASIQKDVQNMVRAAVVQAIRDAFKGAA